MGCPLGETLLDREVRDSDVYLHHRDGHRVPVSVRVTPIMDEKNKEVVGAVEIFHDTSKRDDIIKELEQLREEVLLDELTNIGNRRLADIKLQSHMEEFYKSSVPLGVIFFDIDHFKQFNDKYGHKIGDQVLIMVSKTIANLLRPMDTVARWGGEEFIVILPNINFEILTKVAERIRFFVEKSWLTVDDEIVKVTISIGGTLAKTGDSVETIADRVDSLMYESKNTGRNKVTVSSSV
jgi:diguanylate cyclase (GGDEF)-like protein